MGKSVKEKLVERCRKAYMSNNIPWDEKIAECSTAVLETMADHWERRCDGRPVDFYRDPSNPERSLTIRECKAILDGMCNRVNGPKRHGYQQQIHSNLQYHGTGPSSMRAVTE